MMERFYLGVPSHESATAATCCARRFRQEFIAVGELLYASESPFKDFYVSDDDVRVEDDHPAPRR